MIMRYAQSKNTYYDSVTPPQFTFCHCEPTLNSQNIPLDTSKYIHLLSTNIHRDKSKSDTHSRYTIIIRRF